MFRRLVLKVPKSWVTHTVRFRHSRPNCPMPRDYSKVEKVTICGAANPLGQHLAFMLKKEDIIKEIALYDDCNVRGLALDLEHMNTKCKVKPNSGEYAMKNALRHSDLVVITNGFDASLSEDECRIRENAAIMYKYGMKIASICPDALVCIITPPVNMMVPIFSEATKICDAYDPNKIFGVCSLMEMRANSIVADYLNIDPAALKVPIVGGVSPCTAVPILSHAAPYNEFTLAEMRQLISAILEIPNDCKKLHTAAPLSTAFALSRFVLTLCAGLCKCCCAKQTAYVRSNAVSQVKYFASEIRTGTMGAEANFGLPKIHDLELDMLSQSLVILEKDIEKALCLFEELHGEVKAAEIEEACSPRKPFLKKTPCPPYPTCIPTDICIPKVPDPCAPAKPQNTRIRSCCPE